MRVLSALTLSAALTAALLAPTGPVLAQALPGAPPAFTVTAAQLQAIIAQCRVGNCAAAMQDIIAQARAAGLDTAELRAVISNVAATLVEATRNDPTLAAQVSAAILVAASESGGELADALQEVASLIAAGNVDDIDLNAVAQAAAQDDAGGDAEDEPTGGSPA